MINYILIKEVVIKFVITVICTTILSIEREQHSHPGGVVTHILVSLGSCLFTIVSINFGKDADPSRVAAQIISGMGFLGSATVFKSEKFVKGINTAANLWIAAGIGMAVGLNLWEIALILSFFVMIILIVSNKIYKNKRDNNTKRLKNKQKNMVNETEEVRIQIQREIDDDKNKANSSNFDLINL